MSNSVWRVYRVINRINGKLYFGLTKRTVARRWTHHVWYAKTGDHKCPALHRAICYYGPDAFSVACLCVVGDLAAACEIERQLIAAYGSMAPLGYNLTAGGEGGLGYKHTPEAIERTASTKRGKPLSPHARAAAIAAGAARRGQKRDPEVVARVAATQRGRSMSEAQKQLLRLANLGKTLTAEHRANISAGLMGRKMSPDSIEKGAAKRRGRPQTPTARANMKAASKGKKISPETLARAAAANTGRKRDPALMERIHAKNRGRKHTPEALRNITTGIRLGHARRASAKHQKNSTLTIAPTV